MFSCRKTGALGVVWPELGVMPVIHELAPVTEAVKPKGAVPPPFDTTTVWVKLPGLCCRAFKRIRVGDTTSVDGDDTTVSVTETSFSIPFESITRIRPG